MISKFVSKVVLLLIIFCTTLLADENLPSDQIDFTNSKNLYLNYKQYPKRVFTYQNFSITFNAIILSEQNKYDNIVTTFTHEDNIEVVSKNIKWEKYEANKYRTKITYKVQDKDFILPRITIALVKNSEVIDYISIKSPAIKFSKIAINQKLFSNIIASELNVATAKTKQFTNDILHSTLHIEAKDSNLENFILHGYKEQNIVSLDNNKNEQSLYYSIMIPIYTKQINFTYYNTSENRFIKLQIPMMLDTELVSTQTELNPYNSSILVYKQILSGSLLCFFIILYLFSKKPVYLFFITIILMILTYLFIPNQKLILNKDTKVYILPTSKSTVYKILESKKIAQVINDKGDYVKVLFDNDNIGWVEKHDIK
jgi:hypothetical protein